MNRIALLLTLFFCAVQADEIHYVGVFCAADDKVPTLYKQAAYELGASLAASGHGLVTGGANTGLMNAVMDGFASKGNQEHLYGIIPSVFKELNVHHPDLIDDNIVWTDTIYTRLHAFHNKCSLFVVLPGGYGTLHELMDFIVPKQWGLAKKKIILINIDHYWDHLLLQFQTMVEKNALKQSHLDLLIVVNSVEEGLKAIEYEEDLSHHAGLDDRFWEKT